MKTEKVIAVILVMFALVFNIVAIVILIKTYSFSNGINDGIIKLSPKNIEEINKSAEEVNSQKNIKQISEEKQPIDYVYGIRHKEKPKELPDWVYNDSIEPTNVWMNFYGNIQINKKPAEVGDKIAAVDSNGTLLGIFIIKEQGKYGFFHVYGDDLTTTIKEGASLGDKITFRAYDKSEEKEYATKITNSAEPVFTEYGMMDVDLSA